jgi:dTMP kinase
MFVTFEGPEGAGKSTVIAQIARRLREEGKDPVSTREPGAGPFGAKIREILLHGDDMTPRAELFLFLADRAQHVATVIRPALLANRLVLCDRYIDSTIVYQAVSRGLDVEFVKAANAFATECLVPDRTFLLDLEPEIGLARVPDKDRLDAQPLSFHQSVRNGFLSLAREEPARWVVIDATRPIDTVVEEIWSDAFWHASDST